MGERQAHTHNGLLCFYVQRFGARENKNETLFRNGTSRKSHGTLNNTQFHAQTSYKCTVIPIQTASADCFIVTWLNLPSCVYLACIKPPRSPTSNPRILVFPSSTRNIRNRQSYSIVGTSSIARVLTPCTIHLFLLHIICPINQVCGSSSHLSGSCRSFNMSSAAGRLSALASQLLPSAFSSQKTVPETQSCNTHQLSPTFFLPRAATIEPNV